MKIPEEMIREFVARHYHYGEVIRIPANGEEPSEVICSLGVLGNGLVSVCGAIIGESRPHYHRRTIELYLVNRGALRLAVESQPKGVVSWINLEAGRSYLVQPPLVHFAIGVNNPAEVLVVAYPPWSAADHILVHQQDLVFATDVSKAA